MFTRITLLSMLFFSLISHGSGTSGSSGGSSGAAGGTSPQLDNSMSQKIQAEQEKKLIALKQAQAHTNNIFFDHGHTLLNQILNTHVKVIRNGQATTVNYKNIDKNILNTYLNTLSAVTRSQFNKLTRDQKLAFLINAYNAFTIDLIVRNPNVKSIKDLGNFISSPWKKKIVPLFGEKLSLDDIEHGLIRKDPIFQEPRIHFAVNCASIGCPALFQEAFVASSLNQQLDTVTKNFLSDRQRNRVEKNKVVLSKIFDWYAEDFEKSWQGITSVQSFLIKYSSSIADNPEQEKLLNQKDLEIDYSDYDWSLNKTE